MGEDDTDPIDILIEILRTLWIGMVLYSVSELMDWITSF